MDNITFANNQARRAHFREKDTQPNERAPRSHGPKTSPNTLAQNREGQVPPSTTQNANMEQKCVQVVSQWFMKNIAASSTCKLNLNRQPSDKSTSSRLNAPGALKSKVPPNPKSKNQSEEPVDPTEQV